MARRSDQTRLFRRPAESSVQAEPGDQAAPADTAWRLPARPLLPVIGGTTKHPGSKHGYHPAARRPKPRRELIPPEPMPELDRIENYVADGRQMLTPAQARRTEHKRRRLGGEP